jgi:hypothetical protein
MISKIIFWGCPSFVGSGYPLQVHILRLSFRLMASVLPAYASFPLLSLTHRNAEVVNPSRFFSSYFKNQDGFGIYF